MVVSNMLISARNYLMSAQPKTSTRLLYEIYINDKMPKVSDIKQLKMTLTSLTRLANTYSDCPHI